MTNAYYQVESLMLTRGSLCGVMAKGLDCGHEVSKVKLQLLYSIQFRTKTLEKGMNLLVHPPAMV